MKPYEDCQYPNWRGTLVTPQPVIHGQITVIDDVAWMISIQPIKRVRTVTTLQVTLSRRDVHLRKGYKTIAVVAIKGQGNKLKFREFKTINHFKENVMNYHVAAVL